MGRRVRLVDVPSKPPKPAPVHTVTPHPLAWQEARRLAADRRGVELRAVDGAVLIVNRRPW